MRIDKCNAKATAFDTTRAQCMTLPRLGLASNALRPNQCDSQNQDIADLPAQPTTAPGTATTAAALVGSSRHRQLPATTYSTYGFFALF